MPSLIFLLPSSVFRRSVLRSCVSVNGFAPRPCSFFFARRSFFSISKRVLSTSRFSLRLNSSCSRSFSVISASRCWSSSSPIRFSS